MARTIVVSPRTWFILWLLNLGATGAILLFARSDASEDGEGDGDEHEQRRRLQEDGEGDSSSPPSPSSSSSFLVAIGCGWILLSVVENALLVAFYRHLVHLRRCMCCPSEVPHLKYEFDAATGRPKVTRHEWGKVGGGAAAGGGSSGVGSRSGEQQEPQQLVHSHYVGLPPPDDPWEGFDEQQYQRRGSGGAVRLEEGLSASQTMEMVPLQSSSSSTKQPTIMNGSSNSGSAVARSGPVATAEASQYMVRDELVERDLPPWGRIRAGVRTHPLTGRLSFTRTGSQDSFDTCLIK